VPTATCAPPELDHEHWSVWLEAVLPAICIAPMAVHHRELWDWCWALEPGVRPEPFVGIWARGGAKSTAAEAGCVTTGARGKRRYALYVSATQDQADDHVQNVASLLESERMGLFYPAMADRLVGKFGNSKGWRRNRLRTATGFTVDAIGLDTASRGVKLEEQRPDLIVVDDIDHHDDSPRQVGRKLDTLTKALIPAGAEDLAVVAIQNLVHRDGVFARLVDGRARFLARRKVSGPIPAVAGLVTVHEGGRDLITAGEPTWVGQPLERCQEMIDDMGLAAFLAECQHDVVRREGALWVPEQLAAIRRTAAPELVRISVGVDPSGGDGPDNDEQGIVVAGVDHERAGWVLEDATCRLPPRGWGDRAVERFLDWDASAIVAEVNYGGDMVAEVVRGAVERALGMITAERHELRPGCRVVRWSTGSGPVELHVVSASRGKRVRAEPVAALYGRPDDPATWSTSRIHHAGHFEALEDEQVNWRSDATWSPNRMDAMVWALTDLLVDPAPRGRRRSVVASG